MFSCRFYVDGYCYLFGCRAKDTEAGCCNSYNSCLNAKWLYEYSTMDLKDIHRRERAAEEEARRAREAGKASASVRSGNDSAAKARMEQMEAENRALQSKIRQQELERKREQAKARGERIDEDIHFNKMRNMVICIAVGFLLLFRFAVAGHIYLGECNQAGDFIASVKAMLLALPLCLTTLGVKAIGKEDLFGKTFRGSAFIRSYLAAFVPCLAGLIAMRVIVGMLFKASNGAGSAVASVIVYMLVCALGWALNHSTTKVIWKKGLNYYLDQGK